MTSPEDALAVAYHRATPLIVEITPQLDILPAYFGCLIELAKSSRAHLDRDNVDAAGAAVLHIFEVLRDVATTYHATVGELVWRESLPETESEAQVE